MQKSMTAIDVEIIVGGGGTDGTGYEVHKRKDKREEPTIHTHADAGRIEGRAGGRGGSNKVGRLPSHKCHPREIRAGAARKFLPVRASGCEV